MRLSSAEAADEWLERTKDVLSDHEATAEEARRLSAGSEPK